ncbi:IS200/IS605 family transposase [Elizabethkingia meningoseptica]|uniref:IS200/IS605 family transposase n=1 Tax=Elizabethkingia meningoseptica TaxID=238 RepID=UPI0022F1AE31|nr:IS200/IS605 family transposase [Elizabethkingia meningoseptica]EJK5327241.1 IS200/IS605 family transposase [Elizabethkingia meningoseptica]MDE5466877.1 IS200/IS605 family transposase [Elizabethkingia meningoseptica]MDE5473893.1 IS200/IS605 family transposase [Elizabethkingia meningoseptica]MDE5477326.1 IS200/IS605 family transposase [Elizabethkingia meningoseptica]MDE5484196.1 IS200/IS605 family transposase [Elizabethkingia meningoseptica]
MANTYSQIYIQLVFATKFRESLISELIKDQVEKYICGIFNNKGQKVLAIYANPDHIHIFFSYKDLRISILDLVKIVKVETTNFINGNKLCRKRFLWQEGYGAFSYSKSQVKNVTDYVLNQKVHHQKKSFREEYIDLLNKFEVEYNNEYLFDFFD